MEFLKTNLTTSQHIICIIGPSGTGKSLCAHFLKDVMGYTIATQITTRQPRPDDTHYSYMPAKEFVEKLNRKEIIGYYAGDSKTLTGGNGYGYDIKYLKSLLENPTVKLVLFPSAFEMNNAKHFKKVYSNALKIVMTFKNSNSVYKRAIQAKKHFSECELAQRIEMVNTLNRLIQQYKEAEKDNNLHIIFSDMFGDNIQNSKISQLKEVLKLVPHNTNNINFIEFIKKYEES